MGKKDVTRLVERLKPLEDRAGIRIEGIFATLDDEDNTLYVNGEVHAVTGETIAQDLDLIVTAYDVAGRVMDTTSQFVASEKFFGSEPFSIMLASLANPPTRVRLQAKLA